MHYICLHILNALVALLFVTSFAASQESGREIILASKRAPYVAAKIPLALYPHSSSRRRSYQQRIFTAPIKELYTMMVARMTPEPVEASCHV